MEIRKKQQLQQSIINRLQTSFKYSADINEQYANIIDNVARDIQKLLNTRIASAPKNNGENLEEIENSLVHYGIPDFSQFNPESEPTAEN